MTGITDANNQGLRVQANGSARMHNIGASSGTLLVNRYNGAAWFTSLAANADTGQWFVNQSGSYSSAYGEGPVLQVSQVRGATGSPLALYTWGADSIGARISLGKSRGATLGAQVLVNAGDELGGIYFCGSNGTTMNDVAASITAVAGNTPGSSGAMPGQLLFSTTPSGAAAPTERLRIDQGGAIYHRTASTVIFDANSHLGLRSYTAAAVPNAASIGAGYAIYVSDDPYYRRFAVSDGTYWRFQDGSIVGSPPAWASPLISSTTANPADHHANITLTNGNLVVTESDGSSGATVSGRATAAGLGGRNYYWEVKIDTMDGGDILSGVATAAAGLSSGIGADGSGWGYSARDGHIRNGGSSLGQYATANAGAVIIHAWRRSEGRLWIGKLGSGWFGGGDPAANTSPTVTGVSTVAVPAFSGGYATANRVWSLWYSKALWAGTAPAGFEMIA